MPQIPWEVIRLKPKANKRGWIGKRRPSSSLWQLLIRPFQYAELTQQWVHTHTHTHHITNERGGAWKEEVAPREDEEYLTVFGNIEIFQNWPLVLLRWRERLGWTYCNLFWMIFRSTSWTHLQRNILFVYLLKWKFDDYSVTSRIISGFAASWFQFKLICSWTKQEQICS